MGADRPNPLSANPALLCGFRALQMSLFPMAIITLFWKHHVGMSMTAIFLMQAAFGVAMAAFEFPSGYLADRVGYRTTLLIASLLSVAGWALYSQADSVPAVLASEVTLGIALSLVSGCDSALMYESLRELDCEADYAKWTGRFRFFGQVGEGTAALVAGAMYAGWVRGPFVIEVLAWTTNVYIAWRLVEPQRARPAPHAHWRGHLRQIRSMFRTLLVDNRQLTPVVTLTIALGMASFVPVWMIQLYATEAGAPIGWLGPIWAAANYTVALGSLWSDRASRALGLMPLLALCVVLVAVGYLGLALSTGLFGFAFYFALTSMRGLFGPVLSHEEQRLIPSSDRAGFVSLRSLLFRATFLPVAIYVGTRVDAGGQRPVLLVLAVAMTAAGLLSWNWLRLRRRDTPAA